MGLLSDASPPLIPGIMNNNDGSSEGPGAPDTSAPSLRSPGHLNLAGLAIGNERNGDGNSQGNGVEAAGVEASRPQRREPVLPPLRGSMAHSHSRGEVFRVEGTNVVRVPFGVRQSRRARPERPDRWVTLVLPFQSSPTPTPPQAA